MGSAKNISWSWSRQSLMQRCPRAFFFAYYPWGEPEQDALVFLKQARSIPLLVGDVAHFFIALSLRQYQENGRDVGDITPHAVRRYDEQLRWSARLAEAARAGRRPGTHGSVLMHHLEAGPSETMETAGRETLIQTLEAFYQSEALKFLRTTDRKMWKSITGATDELPYIEARENRGFNKKMNGLRLYMPYDVALEHKKGHYIIDWKTGERKAPSVSNGYKQLAAYSIGSQYAHETKPVAVQPVFLRPGEKWEPRFVTSEAQQEARDAIECHHLRELELVERVVERGDRGYAKVTWCAKREDFPAKPRKPICAMCNFRFICDEGKAEMKKETPSHSPASAVSLA